MGSYKFALIFMSLILAVYAGKTRKAALKSSLQGSRLIGGQPVNVNDVPFIVSIKNVPFDYHKCAGFLVDDRHLVTTATCLYPAVKGEAQAYLFPSTLDNVEHRYVLNDWVIHHNYSVLPRENDIAVATLRRPVSGLKPDKFPHLSKWASFEKGTVVTTYGWGYSKIDKEHYKNFTLHEKKLKMMSNAMCSLLLHEYLGCDTLCASSNVRFASASTDIGTPLVYKTGGVNYYIGILTKPSERLVSAATYMSLYEYRDFIMDVIEGRETETTTMQPTEPPTTTTTTTTTTEEAYEEEVEEEGEEEDEEDTEDEDDTGDEYDVDEDYDEDYMYDDRDGRQTNHQQTQLQGRRRKFMRHHRNGKNRFGKYRFNN